MGPKQYVFAATQAAFSWQGFQLAPKTHTKKRAGARSDHSALRLSH